MLHLTISPHKERRSPRVSTGLAGFCGFAFWQLDIGHELPCAAGGAIALFSPIVLLDSLQTLQDTFVCNMINDDSPRIKANSASKKEAKIHQSEAILENYSGK